MTLAEYLVGKQKRAFARKIGSTRLSQILHGPRKIRETEKIVIEYETDGQVNRERDWPNGEMSK